FEYRLLCFPRRAEVVVDAHGHFARQGHERGQFAAEDVDDIVLADDARLAADGAGIRGAADQRPDAGEGRGHVATRDRSAEVAVVARQQIVDLFIRRADV